MTRFLSSLALAAVLTAAPAALQLSAASATPGQDDSAQAPQASQAPQEQASGGGGVSMQRACSNCW